MEKFFSRNRIVSFAIIGPDARACANQLRNKRRHYSILRQRFRERDDLFAETGGPFVQVKLRLARIGGRGFELRHWVIHWSLVLRHLSFSL